MTTTIPTSPDAERVTAAARRLAEAYLTRTPCDPVRDLIGSTDLDLAYAVQQQLLELVTAHGTRVVGRKIGATSEAVQRQLGVDRPDFGVLLDDMDVSGLPAVPWDRLIQPKAEAEVAFVLREDLADGPLDRDQLIDAVDFAVAALEIVDSRIKNWDISFADTVSDNASSGLYVLGDHRVSLTSFDPRDVQMSMAINGEVVSTGDGRACLGDPLAALAWLARQARDYGEPLRAGQLVLSGALGPMAAVRPGDQVSVELSHLGDLTVEFDQREG